MIELNRCFFTATLITFFDFEYLEKRYMNKTMISIIDVLTFGFMCRALQMKKIARRQQQQQQQQEQEQMAGGRRGPNRGGRQSNDDSEGIATSLPFMKTNRKI